MSGSRNLPGQSRDVLPPHRGQLLTADRGNGKTDILRFLFALLRGDDNLVLLISGLCVLRKCGSGRGRCQQNADIANDTHR